MVVPLLIYCAHMADWMLGNETGEVPALRTALQRWRGDLLPCLAGPLRV